MKTWLSGLSSDLSFQPSSPEELARYDLSRALPDLGITLETVPAMGESYRIVREPDGRYTVSGGSSGVLYGAYALIRMALSGKTLPEELSSSALCASDDQLLG